jgi:hypothetical protein
MKLSVLLGSIILATTLNVSAQSNFDYGSALDAAMKFFDANRCGPDAGKDNVYSWRGACHTNDQYPGGYHDAGDYVKFGLPQCWSAALLGWAMYEYPSVFEPHKERYWHVMKYFTDYFLLCHPSNGTFIYQVGDGNADHADWDSPEKQTIARPVIKSPVGSDVCGEGAAALALMYLNYKSIDESYAQKCLDVAKDLYSMAVSASGSKETARSSDGSGGKFYPTTSHYDDMTWAAIWLYTATGDDKYLEKVDEWILIKNDPGDDPFQKKWAPAWDDVSMFNLLKLAEITGNETYYNGLVYNLEWFKKGAGKGKSPAGLPIVDTWAPLRYASCEAGLGYTANRLLGYSGNNEIGAFVIDYCLGKNPRNSSYLTGWGNNPPKHPHHRANEPEKDGNAKGMIGALVGGGTDDTFKDDVNDYVMNEVALDYNASFIFGLAAHMYFSNGGKSKNMAPSVSITSPRNNIYLPKGSEVKVNVNAKDADGKVTKIELYKGEELLNSSITSPLTYTFSNSEIGDVTLYAKATDDSSHVSKSQSVTVHFSAPDAPGSMINRNGWVASSSTASPNAPEGGSSALDNDPATRWASGAAMAPGMWFLLDMGYPRTFDQITIDGTGSNSDFPLKLKVFAGNDTGDMKTALLTDSGSLVNVIELPKAETAQYIKLVVEEGQGGSWWSIHEITVRSAGSTPVLKPVAKNNVSDFGINAVLQDKSVRIGYRIPKAGRVTIEEYTLDGVRTGVLFDGMCNTGNFSITRNTMVSGSKMVFYKMSYSGSTVMTKAVLLR